MVCAFSIRVVILCQWGEYLLKVVQPIRDAQKLYEVLKHLKATNKRSYIIFLVRDQYSILIDRTTAQKTLSTVRLL